MRGGPHHVAQLVYSEFQSSKNQIYPQILFQCSEIMEMTSSFKRKRRMLGSVAVECQIGPSFSLIRDAQKVFQCSLYFFMSKSRGTARGGPKTKNN